MHRYTKDLKLINLERMQDTKSEFQEITNVCRRNNKLPENEVQEATILIKYGDLGRIIINKIK